MMNSNKRHKNRMKTRMPPVGRLTGSFEDLQAAGCIQAEMESLRPIFVGLMDMTNCNPCNGCPIWDQLGEDCKAFAKFHSYAIESRYQAKVELEQATTPHNIPSGHEFQGMSVKQIAAKLGVSIGEVRRRKLAGTL